LQRDATRSAASVAPQAALLQAEVAFDLFPPGRFPAVHFDEILCVEGSDGHGCVRCDFFVCSKIFGAQFELARFVFSGFGQSVHGQAQIGQHLIVDDVVEKHSFGVERLLRQDDTVITGKCFVLANGSDPLIEQLQVSPEPRAKL